MKFHRKRGGIFNSFLEKNLKTTNNLPSKKRKLKKVFKKGVDKRKTMC